MSPDAKAFILVFSIDEWKMSAPAGIHACGIVRKMWVDEREYAGSIDEYVYEIN